MNSDPEPWECLQPLRPEHVRTMSIGIWCGSIQHPSMLYRLVIEVVLVLLAGSLIHPCLLVPLGLGVVAAFRPYIQLFL